MTEFDEYEKKLYPAWNYGFCQWPVHEVKRGSHIFSTLTNFFFI